MKWSPLSSLHKAEHREDTAKQLGKIKHELAELRTIKKQQKNKNKKQPVIEIKVQLETAKNKKRADAVKIIIKWYGKQNESVENTMKTKSLNYCFLGIPLKILVKKFWEKRSHKSKYVKCTTGPRINWTNSQHRDRA